MSWSRGSLAPPAAVLSLVLVTSCLVSFTDYPVGEVHPLASAGSAGKGGSSGSAGMAALTDLMIDDFEDGNLAILERANRSGNWYVANDRSGMQTPVSTAELSVAPVTPRDNSLRALHTAGSGFDASGALVRADFNVQSNGESQPYDVSAYTGIGFWARSGNDNTHLMLVSIASLGTDVDCMPCGDHLGSERNVTPDWQQFVLPFTQMTQVGWGGPSVTELEPTEAIGVQVSFLPYNDFDVWIDDLTFY